MLDKGIVLTNIVAAPDPATIWIYCGLKTLWRFRYNTKFPEHHTLKMFPYLSKENLEYLYDLLISLRCHWNKYWQRNTNNFMGYLNILHYRYLSVKYTSASNIITFKIFMYIPLTGVCKKILNWTNWGREAYLNSRDPIWTAVLCE